MLSRSTIENHIPHSGASYDVIVCGGGPAGLGAALAAAKNGARTLLLEARSVFGGVAQLCMWMPLGRLFVRGGQPRGGIHDVLVAKMKSYGVDAWVEGFTNKITYDHIGIHPDYLRLAAFELLEEYGCHYRLYSPVSGVIMDGDTIKGVEVVSKDGKSEFFAGVVIDCTGDADVAHLAGVETIKGRPPDGVMMPLTLAFALANVDLARLVAFKPGKLDERDDPFYALIAQTKQEGFTTAPWYAFDQSSVPGTTSVNNGGMDGIGNLDGTSVRDLTIAERAGIQVATDFIKLARQKQIPGLEECFLMRTGQAVGVRETRRIVGEYVWSGEDAQQGTQFADVVARNYEGLMDAVYFHGTAKYDTEVPYRCLLPRSVENLLVAGRCFSCTYEGLVASRGMGHMIGLGQAAGAAAAVCSQTGASPRRVDIARVQSALRAMGVKL